MSNIIMINLLAATLVLYKDPLVNEFYDELFRHWKPKTFQGPAPLVNIEDDEDDDPGEVDLSEFYDVKGEKVDCEEVEDPPMEMDPYYALSVWTEDDGEGGPEKDEAGEGKDEPGKIEAPEGGELDESKVGGDEPGKDEGKVEKDEPTEEVVGAKVEKGEVGQKLETPSPSGPLVPGPPCQPNLKPAFVPEKMSSSEIQDRIAKVKHLVSTVLC